MIIEADDFEILLGASLGGIRLIITTIQFGSTQQAVSSAERENLTVYYNLPKGAYVNHV